MDENRVVQRRIEERRCGWLVEDWKAAYKWFSVQAAAVLAAVQVAYELLPAAQAYIRPDIFRWMMIVELAAVGSGRIKAQK